MTSSANEVVIEVDPLNDHECMTHLMKLIEFMKEEKIYDPTANAQKLPGKLKLKFNRRYDKALRVFP